MKQWRVLAGICGLVLLTACSGGGLDLIRSAPAARNLAIGDEPNAVLAGSAILSEGGSAADAATAIYFGLAVAYPVSAGLGGGGICLVHDPATGRDEEFDFLARDAGGGGAFAVPGNVRGFAALQLAYGRLSWRRVIAQAEGYAAAGFPISGALAKRLSAASNVIRLDADLSAEFLDESGHVKPPGTMVSNRGLADTLAAIRTEGADALYSGSLAARIADYAASEGGTISAQELAAYLPVRRAPQAVQFGDRKILLPGKSTGAGAFATALFETLAQMQASAPQASNTEAAVVSATKQALANFGVANLPADLGATGFAATDSSGQAVACAVTMNGPFGSGHTVRETGVTLAAAPSKSPAGLSAAFLTPVIALDGSGRLSLVGSGAGGPVGTASIADALARLAKGQVVTRRGKPGDGVATYDTMNAILCTLEAGCIALPDASGHGLGASTAPVGGT